MKFKNKGFTLVEVLVSIVILSIILLTFSNLFVMSNKTSVSNNEKLVAVHLAKATLERIKLDPYSYIKDPRTTGIDYSTQNTFSKTKCPKTSPCEDLFSITINDKKYEISVTASQKAVSNTRGELENKFINIVVDVQLVNSNPKVSSKVEGYVNYE